MTEFDVLFSAGKELVVFGQRSRPTAFDISHAKLIKQRGDAELVADRERNPLLLGPVAQGGVIDFEVGHKKLDIGQQMSD